MEEEEEEEGARRPNGDLAELEEIGRRAMRMAEEMGGELTEEVVEFRPGSAKANAGKFVSVPLNDT